MQCTVFVFVCRTFTVTCVWMKWWGIWQEATASKQKVMSSFCICCFAIPLAGLLLLYQACVYGVGYCLCTVVYADIAAASGY